MAGGIVSLLLVFACAGALYQWVASNRDRRLNPPPGQLVDLGGYRLHLYCIGSGSPTVVLDSGLSDSSLAWYKVQPQMAKFTRVCSYDRAGLGWSDPSPRPRTSRVIAEELHTLLHNAGIAAPFVLVGHSFGGYDVRMYANLYSTEVVGMVLVDSSHPEQDKRFPPELKQYNEDFLRRQGLKEDTMPFGLPRLMGWCGDGPPELRSKIRTIDCRLQSWRTHLAEHASFEESAGQVRATGLLGSIPLVVLSHDPDKVAEDSFAKAMDPAWDQMQEELAHLSANGSRIVAKGSGHMIHQDRPDLVIEAIHKVVEQCRESQSSLRQ